MSEKLKPCPFCGCEKITGETDDYGNVFVWCTECGAQVSADNKARAAVTWNTRKLDTDLVAACKALIKSVTAAIARAEGDA